MNLDYLVIYCSDPEASAEWYASALALRFTKEQHGSRGPLHFSSEIGGTILELYPAADGLPRSRVRLGVTCPTSSASTPRRASSQTRTATASRFAPRRPDPPPRCYTHRMETTRVSTDARRLIAHRIKQGESLSWIAFDFGITEEEAQRIAVSYYSHN